MLVNRELCIWWLTDFPKHCSYIFWESQPSHKMVYQSSYETCTLAICKKLVMQKLLVYIEKLQVSFIYFFILSSVKEKQKEIDQHSSVADGGSVFMACKPRTGAGHGLQEEAASLGSPAPEGESWGIQGLRGRTRGAWPEAKPGLDCASRRRPGLLLNTLVLLWAEGHWARGRGQCLRT